MAAGSERVVSRSRCQNHVMQDAFQRDPDAAAGAGSSNPAGSGIRLVAALTSENALAEAVVFMMRWLCWVDGLTIFRTVA